MNIQMSSSARSGTGNRGRSVNRNGPNAKKRLATILLIAFVIALAIDPVFLFIPEIDYLKLCVGFDETLRTTVFVIRILIDLICLFLIIRFQKYLRGEMGVKKRPPFYLIVDYASLLPIPLIMVFFPPNNLVSRGILKWTIVCQYIPRIIRIYPIYKAVTKTTVTVAPSKWIGALLNLFLFLLCSHFAGTFWYVTAIEKQSKCWSDFWINAIKGGGNLTKLYCARLVDNENNSDFLKNSCPLIDPANLTKPSLAKVLNITEFDFGMYIDVLKFEVGSVDLADFPKKFAYCFWWGLKNLSTFGQGLLPGNSATDSLFAVIICTAGLISVAVLIGNVQKYLLSSTVRADEMEERKRDIEKWMTYRNVPEKLQKLIKDNEKTRWKNFRGTDEESLIRSFPEELRLEIQSHLNQA